MKLKISRSKTEKNYETNKNILKNIKDKNLIKRKNLELNSLSNIYEEYLPRLKYKLSPINSMKNNTNNLFNIQSIFNFHYPFVSNISIKNLKLKQKRSTIFIYRNNINEDKMGNSKYGDKLENIYKEASLENKRKEIETKIEKIKRIMEPLSSELTKILKKIDNYKLELELIKNFDFSESNFKKIYLSQKKSSNTNMSNPNNNENLSDISSERIKTKNLENFIKTEKMKINNKKINIKEKLETLIIKKDNILIKYDSCEVDLKELKKELKLIKDELIIHYHKLLLEGKDTRNEGLSWIIRAIWKLKTNVIMSYLPKFLDQKSIEFLFKYSDKLDEIEQIQKNINKKKDYLKNFGKKIETLNDKLLQYEENKKKEIESDNEDEKKNNLEDNNELNNSVNKGNRFLSPPKRKKTHRTPSIVLLQTIKKRNKLRNELTPISALKRLLSEKDNLINIKLSKKGKKHKEKELDFEKTISKFDEETFKTSLYETKKSFKNIKLNNINNINNLLDKQKQRNNKIIKNLELMLDDPNYLDKLTSHLTPPNKIKISDYKNITNYKMEDIYDSNLVKIFNEHKTLLLKLKEKKKSAEKFVRNELDRISKCFYLEDYAGKFNINIKSVIGALIGEDNSKIEIFRQQKEQKDYFKTIKNLRTFSLLNKKIC